MLALVLLSQVLQRLLLQQTRWPQAACLALTQRWWQPKQPRRWRLPQSGCSGSGCGDVLDNNSNCRLSQTHRVALFPKFGMLMQVVTIAA